MNPGGEHAKDFLASRSCTLSRDSRAEWRIKMQKAPELTVDLVMEKSAAFEPPLLKTTVRRWAVVVRAALASAWLLAAPWLAALAARS